MKEEEKVIEDYNLNPEEMWRLNQMFKELDHPKINKMSAQEIIDWAIYG